MPRDTTDLHHVLTAFTGWIRERPEAGVVVGTVRIAPCDGEFSVQIGHVGCSPAELVVAAAECLQTAAEQIRAKPGLGDAGRESLTRIEQAIIALGFANTAVRPS